MKKRIWIIIGAVVLIGLAVMKLAGNKQKIDEKKKVAASADVQIPVNVLSVQMGKLGENIVKTGTLIPHAETNIAATAAGTLQTVSFDLGSTVSKGQIIAQIDNALLALKLEAAVIQQQKLQTDYDRVNRLVKGEAATETSLQDIKYNLDNVTNQINQIKKQMADNQIKAPLSGQITVKNVEAGEFVNTGAVLGKMVDVSRLKVDVQVSENEAYKLHNGQDVRVTTDLYPGQIFNGKVIFISQQADAAHNYQVQVELPNSSAHPLKAGTFVYADFVQPGEREALLIPRSALVESMKNPYVYIVKDGKALARKITVGKENQANIEVVSGLAVGDQVVVNGQINLADSSAVSIVK